MKAMPLKNFHLPLPEDVYEELRRTAERLRLPATQAARRGLEAWLAEERRRALHDEIAAYARKHAGTEADLDGELEEAATAHLLDTGREGR